MKNKYLSSTIILTSLIIGGAQVSAMDREEQTRHPTISIKTFKEAPIDYNTITAFLAQHSSITDSSKDKDIIVVLGNTGAGKSTLVNYLAGKPLKFIQCDRIELENTADSEAMAIGNKGGSCTSIPQFIQMKDEFGSLIYDFPGLEDTGGFFVNLMNASFIKKVIENAKTVKLIFVANKGAFMTDRAKSLKIFSEVVEKLIPESDNRGFKIEENSCLVVSNVKSSWTDETFNNHLETTAAEVISLWGSKIGRFNGGDWGEKVDDTNRGPLLKLISQVKSMKVCNVDVSHVYPFGDKKELQSVFLGEGQEISKKIKEANPVFKNLKKQALEQRQSFYNNNFEGEALKKFNQSPLVLLLQPIAKLQFKAATEAYKKELSADKVTFLKDVNYFLDQIQADEDAEKARQEIRTAQEKNRNLESKNSRLKDKNKKLKEKGPVSSSPTPDASCPPPATYHRIVTPLFGSCFIAEPSYQPPSSLGEITQQVLRSYFPSPF